MSTDIFRDLKELETLDLRNNGLLSLNSTVFAGLENLRHLRLSDNWLSELPEKVFQDLRNLQVNWPVYADLHTR